MSDVAILVVVLGGFVLMLASAAINHPMTHWVSALSAIAVGVIIFAAGSTDEDGGFSMFELLASGAFVVVGSMLAANELRGRHGSERL